MTENDIIELLDSGNQDNLICRAIETRPQNLAMFIATLANNKGQCGYILLGVRFENLTYNIIGFSKDFKIEKPINDALAMLSNAPKIEIEHLKINNKNVAVIKIENKDEDVFFDLELNKDNNIDMFLKDLLRLCVKLQANIHFRNVSEDIRNDYMRDMLSYRNYDVKDQTRHGCSATGISAGEVDILIEESNMPFTIIEALILSSLSQDYLNMHLDKIYNYDTTGHKFNICLTYAEMKDFSSFWNKYCDHVSVYDYPVALVGFDKNADDNFPYSEIRFMTTTHNRSGKLTILYHVAVKLK